MDGMQYLIPCNEWAWAASSCWTQFLPHGSFHEILRCAVAVYGSCHGFRRRSSGQTNSEGSTASLEQPRRVLALHWHAGRKEEGILDRVDGVGMAIQGRRGVDEGRLRKEQVFRRRRTALFA